MDVSDLLSVSRALSAGGVNVTDVLIELRGLMVRALKEVRDEVRPVSGM